MFSVLQRNINIDRLTLVTVELKQTQIFKNRSRNPSSRGAETNTNVFSCYPDNAELFWINHRD